MFLLQPLGDGRPAGHVPPQQCQHRHNHQRVPEARHQVHRQRPGNFFGTGNMKVKIENSMDTRLLEYKLSTYKKIIIGLMK